MALRANDSIGPYLLIRPLGRGAFGEVWLARHHHLEQDCALKVPTDPAYVRQLRNEATIQFRLNHPNIVHTLDLIPNHDPPYCVMEYVAGVNLRQKLRAAGKLPLAAAHPILCQILLALEHAHAAGICHRDLKPENILCRADGVVKVTDFGFGKVQAVLAQSMIYSGSLANAGSGISGTIQYMSPQQQAGDEADPKDDLYAIGIIACELLTGSRPQPMGVTKMLERAGIDVAFAGVLERAMEHDRKDRYASAAEMRNDLDTFSVAKLEQSLTGKSEHRRPAALPPAVAALELAQPPQLHFTNRYTQPVSFPPFPTRSPRMSTVAWCIGLLLLGGIAAVWRMMGKMAPVDQPPRYSIAITPPNSISPIWKTPPVPTSRQSPAAIDAAPATIEAPVPFQFVRIESGELIMGGTRGANAGSTGDAQHRVTLTKPFMIATTVVTQAQWKSVMGNNPSLFRGDDLPVEQVSWGDAVAFCEILSRKQGKKYRLPTEAEWEYACRAGTTTMYHTGDGELALKQAGWYSGNSGGKTHEVGRKKPNACGLYDMHGNVWQWCSDYFGPYPTTAAVDPTGPSIPDAVALRVVRGGSWFSNYRGCTSGYRSRELPGSRFGYVGFRVCMDADDQLAFTTLPPERAGGPPPDPTVKNSVGMKLALIPRGAFMMGSWNGEAGRQTNETRHKATLTKSFYMQVTTVTQAQWKAVMGTDPSLFKGDDHPVEQVSCNDALDFCRKLSKKEGKNYRLPTEAEWEYACRAGTTAAYGGNGHLDDMGWFNSAEHVEEKTHPVAQLQPNSWGLYDMHGNVWQWCSDGYADYVGDATDPQGANYDSGNVLRGGSWASPAQQCRCAYRNWGPPGERYCDKGFRVCLDVQ